MKKLLYLFLAITFIGCSSDDSGNNSTNLQDLTWQITVDGQTYETFTSCCSGWGAIDCNDVSAFAANFGGIDTATRYYTLDILHNDLTSDFEGTSVGSYPIKGDYLDNDCNLTLSVTLSDYGSPVISDGTHIVTSINQISSSNNETEWLIKGDFSGTYSDQSNNNLESINFTGSYEQILNTYQD